MPSGNIHFTVFTVYYKHYQCKLQAMTAMSESYVFALIDVWIYKIPAMQVAEGQGHLGH